MEQDKCRVIFVFFYYRGPTTIVFLDFSYTIYYNRFATEMVARVPTMAVMARKEFLAMGKKLEIHAAQAAALEGARMVLQEIGEHPLLLYTHIDIEKVPELRRLWYIPGSHESRYTEFVVTFHDPPVRTHVDVLVHQTPVGGCYSPYQARCREPYNGTIFTFPYDHATGVYRIAS